MNLFNGIGNLIAKILPYQRRVTRDERDWTQTLELRLVDASPCNPQIYDRRSRWIPWHKDAWVYHVREDGEFTIHKLD